MQYIVISKKMERGEWSMKEPKLCTFSFYIKRGEEEVPFESIPEEEQKEFKKQFTRDFMDSFMRQKGYRRCET